MSNPFAEDLQRSLDALPNQTKTEKPMTLLKPLSNAPGYLKAGFLGFAGSGKTFTATQLAVATRAHFNLPGPIGYFDTENGTPFVSAYVQRETGLEPVGVKSRSLADLKETTKECVAAGVSVLVVDSITHVWREACETYLATINAARQSSRMQKLDRLEFQHWAYLKSGECWGGWTDLFLNAPLHVIVCGRAGYDYDFETDERGKKQLVRTGVKMKVEGEFGFEPSIVVEMTAEQVMEAGEVKGVVHKALVLKDRTMDPAQSLVGKSCDEPTAAFFAPHLAGLRPAQHEGIDLTRKTEMQVDEGGSAEWARERRERDALCEEITGALDVAGLGGSTNEAKQKRAKLLDECFGTSSKTRLENTKADVLREGLGRLRVRLAETGGAA